MDLILLQLFNFNLVDQERQVAQKAGWNMAAPVRVRMHRLMYLPGGPQSSMGSKIPSELHPPQQFSFKRLGTYSCKPHPGRIECALNLGHRRPKTLKNWTFLEFFRATLTNTGFQVVTSRLRGSNGPEGWQWDSQVRFNDVVSALRL